MSDTEAKDAGPEPVRGTDGPKLFVNALQRQEAYGIVGLRLETAASFREVADAAANAADGVLGSAVGSLELVTALAKALAEAFEEKAGESFLADAGQRAFGKWLSPAEKMLLNVPTDQVLALGGGSATRGASVVMGGLQRLLTWHAPKSR